MDKLITTLIIVGLISLIFVIFALMYGISAIRRRAIMIKKLDYLIEDITYKSEMLNTSVETVAKLANYIDIFEVVARKNIKSATKLVARNKEDIYHFLDRIKEMVLGEKDTQHQTQDEAK